MLPTYFKQIEMRKCIDFFGNSLGLAFVLVGGFMILRDGHKVARKMGLKEIRPIPLAASMMHILPSRANEAVRFAQLFRLVCRF